jgi:branched-chain amino acid transport system ATP-binding protein
MPLLRVEDLHVYYGDYEAIFGVNLTVEKGETVAIVGANGAGKSTFLKAISGINSQKTGRVTFNGDDISKLRADLISRRGITMVPEGRRLFPSLTVEENLLIGTAVKRPGVWTLESVMNLFPALRELRNHPAWRVSGGQQQMVAIGRALLANPELLLCDELSLGLAPKIIDDIYAKFEEISAGGTSIVIVEQDVARARAAASRVYCLLEGSISLEGPAASLSMDEISRAYFGM